jgi:major membrane immunogen (membrane-anchored lipoprotein)
LRLSGSALSGPSSINQEEKMKNQTFRLSIAVIMVSMLSFCARKNSVTGPGNTELSGNYIDGFYHGQTLIDHEGYTALANVEVTRARISVVDWQIYDTYRKIFFNADYEKVYAGNELYIRQCRDNMVGMNVFGPELIETQDLNEVDNITGATWCYRKFKEVMQITLKDAYAEPPDSTETP